MNKCEENFEKYSMYPCVFAEDGDFNKAHNYFFYSAGWKDSAISQQKRVDELERQLGKSERVLKVFMKRLENTSRQPHKNPIYRMIKLYFKNKEGKE